MPGKFNEAHRLHELGQQYGNPVDVSIARDEIHRQALETARDAFRSVLVLLLQGEGTAGPFGVQHVGGRITLTVHVAPDPAGWVLMEPQPKLVDRGE